MVAVCVQSSALEWKGLGSPEPQLELGPEQTNVHAWPLPEGSMWKGSDELGLPFKEIALRRLMRGAGIGCRSSIGEPVPFGQKLPELEPRDAGERCAAPGGHVCRKGERDRWEGQGRDMWRTPSLGMVSGEGAWRGTGWEPTVEGKADSE